MKPLHVVLLVVLLYVVLSRRAAKSAPSYSDGFTYEVNVGVPEINSRTA